MEQTGQRPFDIVDVFAGDAKVVHEVQRLRSVFIESFKQVSRFGLFRSATLTVASLALGFFPNFEKWVLPIPEELQ